MIKKLILFCVAVLVTLQAGAQSWDTQVVQTTVEFKLTAQGKWALVDTEGKVILYPFIYDNGPDYLSEGLFRFVEDGKIGFANEEGQKIIPAQFDFVTPFEYGRADYVIGGHKEYTPDGEHWIWSDEDVHERGVIDRSGARIVVEKLISDPNMTRVNVINTFAIDDDAFLLFLSLAKSRCIDILNGDRHKPTTLFDDHYTTLYDQMYSLPGMFKKESVLSAIDKFYAENIADVLRMMKIRNEKANMNTVSPVVFAEIMFDTDNVTHRAYLDLVNNASAYTQLYLNDYLQGSIANRLTTRRELEDDPEEEEKVIMDSSRE